MRLQACPKAGTEEYLDFCGPVPPTGTCDKFPQLCENGVCMDEGVNYRCECQQGYEYNDDLHVCEGKETTQLAIYCLF